MWGVISIIGGESRPRGSPRNAAPSLAVRRPLSASISGSTPNMSPAHNDGMATSLPPPEAPPPSAPRNDYAVASFVLGLLSVPLYLFGIFSILAVIAGVLGLRKPPRALPNIVLASTGIALGALSFLMGLVMLGVGR
jgi:hypothetical protein